MSKFCKLLNISKQTHCPVTTNLTQKIKILFDFGTFFYVHVLSILYGDCYFRINLIDKLKIIRFFIFIIWLIVAYETARMIFASFHNYKNNVRQVSVNKKCSIKCKHTSTNFEI